MRWETRFLQEEQTDKQIEIIEHVVTFALSRCAQTRAAKTRFRLSSLLNCLWASAKWVFQSMLNLYYTVYSYYVINCLWPVWGGKRWLPCKYTYVLVLVHSMIIASQMGYATGPQHGSRRRQRVFDQVITRAFEACFPQFLFQWKHCSWWGSWWVTNITAGCYTKRMPNWLNQSA